MLLFLSITSSIVLPINQILAKATKYFKNSNTASTIKGCWHLMAYTIPHNDAAINVKKNDNKVLFMIKCLNCYYNSILSQAFDFSVSCSLKYLEIVLVQKALLILLLLPSLLGMFLYLKNLQCLHFAS